MDEIHMVTFGGVPVTANGVPVALTINGVAGYIDASREALSDSVADSVLEWLRINFPDWSYVIDSVDYLIGAMRSGLARFLNPDTIEMVVELLLGLLG